jgi:hypothetical protein
MAPGHREVLLNERVIAIDQDPLGIMGRLVHKVSSPPITLILLDFL